MPVAPALAALAVLAASAAWSVRLVLAGEPLDTWSAALAGFDAVLLAAVVAAGIMLARARWSRRAAVLLLAAQLAVLPALPSDGWNAAVAALGALALAAAAGPWLRGWLRELPNAEGPPGSVVVLLLGLLALPAVAALANPSGAVWGAWLLAAIAVGCAWAIGQAHPTGLWLARIGLLPAAIPALLQSTLVGGVALGAAVAFLTSLAWLGETGRTVVPLAPQPVKTFPIPPELVPPEVLRDAGYDERGRPARGE